jgi:hypothetical protein
MKIICMLLFSTIASIAVAAQGYGEKVQVWLNKTALVKKYQTGGAAQEFSITPAMMGKTNTIKITQAGFNEKDWKRIFTLIDSMGNEALVFEKNGPSGTFLWKVNGLPALLKKSGRLMLHTTALPTDPNKVALVRVARYHVCTLVYKP